MDSCSPYDGAISCGSDERGKIEIMFVAPIGMEEWDKRKMKCFLRDVDQVDRARLRRADNGVDRVAIWNDLASMIFLRAVFAATHYRASH